MGLFPPCPWFFCGGLGFEVPSPLSCFLSQIRPSIICACLINALSVLGSGTVKSMSCTSGLRLVRYISMMWSSSVHPSRLMQFMNSTVLLMQDPFCVNVLIFLAILLYSLGSKKVASNSSLRSSQSVMAFDDFARICFLVNVAQADAFPVHLASIQRMKALSSLKLSFLRM